MRVRDTVLQEMALYIGPSDGISRFLQIFKEAKNNRKLKVSKHLAKLFLREKILKSLEKS